MIEGIVDIYILHHILAAFAIGFFASLFFKDIKKLTIFAVVVPVFWEVIEQNILVSWTELLEPEPFLNSLADIGVGIIFILAGFFVGRKILKR